VSPDGAPLTLVFDGLTVPVAGEYEIDPVHTFIEFGVRHLVVGRVRAASTRLRVG
jgi:polyisoprenoid-binding protein YceI